MTEPTTFDFEDAPDPLTAITLALTEAGDA